MGDIQARVINVVADRLAPDNHGRVIPESLLIDDLGADSLDLVELTMAMEEEFAILISDEDAENFKTVQDIIERVQKIVG